MTQDRLSNDQRNYKFKWQGLLTRISALDPLKTHPILRIMPSKKSHGQKLQDQREICSKENHDS